MPYERPLSARPVHLLYKKRETRTRGSTRTERLRNFEIGLARLKYETDAGGIYRAFEKYRFPPPGFDRESFFKIPRVPTVFQFRLPIRPVWTRTGLTDGRITRTCVLQILQLRVPLLFGIADLHEPETRRRPGDVHQQGPVLRHHHGVHTGPGQTADQPDGQGECTSDT